MKDEKKELLDEWFSDIFGDNPTRSELVVARNLIDKKIEELDNDN